MERKCICLIRVSSIGQDIEQQTQVVKNEALKDGYKEKNIILIEDHESAIKLSEEERNGLNRMKSYILNDSSVDCVYVYEVSRISRQTKIVYSIRDWLIERNIQLCILKPYIKLLNPDGTISETSTIFFSIFSGLAESEMYLKKQRLKRGFERAKAMGRHASGHVPFGYYVDKNHLYHIKEDEAAAVKWMFENYVNGMSTRRIAREFIDKGIFKTTFLTATIQVHKLIHNDRYCGRQNGKPQIVSEELFEKAQEIAHRNRCYSDRKEVRRICKGLLYDRNSGFLLSASEHGQFYRSQRKNGVAVSFKVIEPLIWDYALKKYKKLCNQNTSEKARRITQDIVDLNLKINRAVEIIEEKKQQLDKLEERIILGKVNEKLADKLSLQINNELKEANNKMINWKDEEHKRQLQYRELVSRQKMTELSDGTAYFESKYNEEDLNREMDIEERIELVNQVIEKIILDRPCRAILNMEIYNKVDVKPDKFSYDCFRYKFVK